MNALIPLHHRLIGQAQVQTVNARELHAFLEVGKDFSTWIKDRITQYSFVENQDFAVFPEIGENPTGGRPSKESALTKPRTFPRLLGGSPHESIKYARLGAAHKRPSHDIYRRHCEGNREHPRGRYPSDEDVSS